MNFKCSQGSKSTFLEKLANKRGWGGRIMVKVFASGPEFKASERMSMLGGHRACFKIETEQAG